MNNDDIVTAGQAQTIETSAEDTSAMTTDNIASGGEANNIDNSSGVGASTTVTENTTVPGQADNIDTNGTYTNGIFGTYTNDTYNNVMDNGAMGLGAMNTGGIVTVFSTGQNGHIPELKFDEDGVLLLPVAFVNAVIELFTTLSNFDEELSRISSERLIAPQSYMEPGYLEIDEEFRRYLNEAMVRLHGEEANAFQRFKTEHPEADLLRELLPVEYSPQMDWGDRKSTRLNSSHWE